MSRKKFWTDARKRKLLQQSKRMTLPEMSKEHGRSKREIAALLLRLNPRPFILRTYMEGGHKVTVYYPGYAAGYASQQVGDDIAHI